MLSVKILFMNIYENIPHNFFYDSWFFTVWCFFSLFFFSLEMAFSSTLFEFSRAESKSETKIIKLAIPLSVSFYMANCWTV